MPGGLYALYRVDAGRVVPCAAWQTSTPCASCWVRKKASACAWRPNATGCAGPIRRPPCWTPSRGGSRSASGAAPRGHAERDEAEAEQRRIAGFGHGGIRLRARREAELLGRHALQRQRIGARDAQVVRRQLLRSQRLRIEPGDAAEQRQRTQVRTPAAGVRAVVEPQVEQAVGGGAGRVHVAGGDAVFHCAQERVADRCDALDPARAGRRGRVGVVQVGRHRFQARIVRRGRRRREADGARRRIGRRCERRVDQVRPRPCLVQVDVGGGAGVRIRAD
ncbi:conserved hypothetical protein, partial [Ricinus communis]